MLIPVILCGGSGSRLWPLSRNTYPKQFLKLLHEETLLQRTINRLKGLHYLTLIIVCNEEHRFIVAEQIRQIGIENATIILEPFGKNTAPAIAAAAIHAKQVHKNPTLLILSADHEIKDEASFQLSITQAYNLVKSKKLITFGIVPGYAATGYGYIKRAQAVETGFEVSQFVEKPCEETAEEFVKSGEYYWNSGMFMFEAKIFIDELSKFKPEVVKYCKLACRNMTADFNFHRIDAEAFEHCESISIDYAVMERTSRAVVVPMDAGWSDIGSWESLWEEDEQDENGNVILGDVISTENSNCYIRSEHRLVAAQGLRDIIVVETSDAVLVANMSSAQQLKKILSRLAANNRAEEYSHQNIYRPWGRFDSIDTGKSYRVNRITINPGASISVQMHHHRAEHWVVVSGTAKVYRNDKEFLIAENESIFIPLGHTHSLANPGIIPLEIIEIQSGAYLGDDDIVRFENNHDPANTVK